MRSDGSVQQRHTLTSFLVRNKSTMTTFVRMTPAVVALLLCVSANAFKEIRRPVGFSPRQQRQQGRASSILLLLDGKPREDVRHGRNPLFVSGGNQSEQEPPLSQVESLRNLAKSLNFFGNSKDDNALPVASKEKQRVYAKSVASGLAVSLAMIPEAISFSYVAGVSPLVGLWTTVVLGFVAAAFGGRPGICSSASGACSVVVAPLCAVMGAPYLSICAMLAGILQILFRSTGKFIRLVPHPVMLGFVNGLAVVMARAQLVHFKDASGAFLSLSNSAGRSTIGLTALAAFLVRAIPRVKALQAIPPTLGAVTICSLLQKVLQLPGVRTLADVSGADTFRGGWSVLPKLSFWPSEVPFSLETLKIVAPYAITMAAVGAIESLLTAQLIDGIMEEEEASSTKQECLGQGLGNLAAGLTGGIGGCALLGQSIINVESGGGRSRLSGISMSLFLALGILAGAPLLANIPVAALVGVMLCVCQSTFSWSSLRILHKIPKLDTAIIFLVSFITVKDDLAKAVVTGVIASALGFAWKQSTEITAATQEATKKSWKTYSIKGPLFFGSTTSFSKLFSNLRDDPSDVVIDFTESRVCDHSALEAIQSIADKYNEAGKKVHLKHLSDDCSRLLTRLHGEASPYQLIIESDPKTDPVYSIAAN